MLRRHFLIGGAISARALGAAGDGATLDSAAIQKSIDVCAERGGGVVTLPAGRYLCGTLLLRDNVTLHLDDGARLMGSLDIAHYQNIDSFTDGTGSAMGYCLIGAVDAKNAGITGAGTIDGQGKELLARINKDRGKRPFLVRFVRCAGVSMSGVRLEAPAAWTTHFFQCRDVTAERVTINSHAGSNNDGFDIDSCQGVRIRDCTIDTGDDAICLKTTSRVACRDVVVTGCTLTSNCAAFKMGTESAGDFEGIRVSDCRIPHAGLGGIKLLSVDGARLRNVEVSGITMESGHVAVFLRLGTRLKTFRPGDEKRGAGSLSGVHIRDVKADVESTGMMICGVPGHAVEDVTLERIELRLSGAGTKEDARLAAPEQEAAYPEIRMFGPRLPAYGLWARHVRAVRVDGLTLKTATPDPRPAAVCQDAEGLRFASWKATGVAEAEALIRLEGVRDAVMDGFQVDGDAKVFLRVEGANSSGIRLGSNRIGASKEFECEGGAAEGAVIRSAALPRDPA